MLNVSHAPTSYKLITVDSPESCHTKLVINDKLQNLVMKLLKSFLVGSERICHFCCHLSLKMSDLRIQVNPLMKSSDIIRSWS